MKYEVPVKYSGLANYIVQANSIDEAMEKARTMFRNGKKESILGNEAEYIEEVFHPRELP